MLSTEETSDIANRIKYPNLSVDIYDHPQKLHLGISCIDVHYQTPTTVGVTVPITIDALEDEETFIKFIFLIISTTVLHEMAEQFMFDGKRIFDPHADKQEFSISMITHTEKAKLEMGGNLKNSNWVVMPHRHRPTSESARMAPKAPSTTKGPWFNGFSFKKDSDPGFVRGGTIQSNKLRMVNR